MDRYDVAVVGAGPVGSVCALAFAQKGARVALLEANPKAARRLAGEWLHPPAVRMLRSVGITLDTQPHSIAGKGFAVFPEDGSEPIVLPYPDGSHGLACEHAELVSCLHEAVENEPGIDFLLHARVREVGDGELSYSRNGADQSLDAARIVGADGRASIVRQSLGLSTKPMPCSRMVGVMLEGVDLPLKGYGHVVLGAPGPLLVYHVAEHSVRIVADVPLDQWAPSGRLGLLAGSYAGLLPEALRAAFVEALQAGKFNAAANEFRQRVSYGNPDRVLIGDAAGHYHPLTAVGMTLGFGDALALAGSRDFHDFKTRRIHVTRAPEFLAMGIYEVFADHRAEVVALRHAMYRGWRMKPSIRKGTIRLLGCEDTSTTRLGFAFTATVLRAIGAAIPRSFDQVAWRRVRDLVHALAVRLWWLVNGVQKLYWARRAGREKDNRVRDTLSRAFLISMAPNEGNSRQAQPKKDEPPDAGPALRRASAHLLSLQGEDGAWEGEMVWCPMLTAQYVLLHHIIGRPLDPGRRRRVLRSFECTRVEEGLWSLHEYPPPNLFVTTLVYVAARLLGVERDDPLIEPARRFLQEEGALGIPSWGKFWLALLNLYDWRGVNAILPELWSLPRWTVLHPSNWYCHTRLIYLAMAAVYPHRFQAPVTPIIASLREELFPEGFDKADFSRGRNLLREADLYARPGVWLRAGYGFARLYERFHNKRLRARSMEALIRQIRWELQATGHTNISPVSGFLNILALWLRDPDDDDCRRALAQLDGWIWEDEARGARVTGARSSSWDTGFSLQALATVPGLDGVGDALRKGAGFLRGQQVGAGFEGFREAYRTDPKGGWCFPGAWHGWPVSDCTAEAVLGILAADHGALNEQALGDAVRFMLRTRNRDGGFGSYEARRSAFDLEWLNPAEMFGDSMTERSYVECTASCLAALAACRERFPQVADQAAADAIARGGAWLRRVQASDGSWRGVWGVQFIYGALFGIRGLRAAGALPGDPAVRAACRWLLERQRRDGGWGEHHSGCLAGRYVEHGESQVIQTAWALIALLEAGDANWGAITRGARFLMDAQEADGSWPRQDMAGVFFRTALLDYVLYRQYFPLHAPVQRRRQVGGLPHYEPRRRAQPGADTPLNSDIVSK